MGCVAQKNEKMGMDVSGYRSLYKKMAENKRRGKSFVDKWDSVLRKFLAPAKEKINL